MSHDEIRNPAQVFRSLAKCEADIATGVQVEHAKRRRMRLLALVAKYHQQLKCQAHAGRTPNHDEAS